MKNKFLSYILLTFFVTITLSAQKENPPVGGTPKDFRLPAKSEFSLSNGIIVTMVPYGSLPKVTIAITIKTGALDESNNQVWLSDFTGDMLKEGTTTRTAAQLAESFAGMGGEVSVSAGDDQTVISTDVLSEFGVTAISVLSDLIQNPVFNQTDIERVKKDYIRNLSVSKSRPQSLAVEKFKKVIYGDHPYGNVFSTEEMIKSFSKESVQAFYDNNFGALRTRIYVVGKYNESEVKTAIEKGFSKWLKGKEALVNIPVTKKEESTSIVERQKASQSTIYLGVPAIDPSNSDYLKFQLANTLLGGYFSSRVTTNIRERKGYTYSPSSSVSSRYRSGYWVQVADVSTNVTGAAITEILHEIDSLQNTAPPKKELESVQNYSAGIFVLQNSTRGGILGLLSFINLHKLQDDYLDTYVKRVFAVTPEEISSMVSKYIQKDKLTLVVVGDKGMISEQLKLMEKKP